MTLQVVSLIRRSSRKQHGTENNRSWLSTCSQVIRPWVLKIQLDKPCHTFAKLDVSQVHVPNFGGVSGSEDRGGSDNSIYNSLILGGWVTKVLKNGDKKIGGWKGG